jgi:hypothetical protein
MAEDKGAMDQLITDVKQLRARAGVVGDAAGEAAGNVGEAVSSVADELKKGYQRIKGLL